MLSIHEQRVFHQFSRSALWALSLVCDYAHKKHSQPQENSFNRFRSFFFFAFLFWHFNGAIWSDIREPRKRLKWNFVERLILFQHLKEFSNWWWRWWRWWSRKNKENQCVGEKVPFGEKKNSIKNMFLSSLLTVATITTATVTVIPFFLISCPKRKTKFFTWIYHKFPGIRHDVYFPW